MFRMSACAEAVDGLIVVAHHAEIAVFLGQQLDQDILGVVRILVLVDQDVSPAFLVARQDLRPSLKSRTVSWMRSSKSSARQRRRISR